MQARAISALETRAAVPGTAVAFRAVARAWILLPVLAALAGCSATRHPAGDGLALVASDAADAVRLERMRRIGRDLALATLAPERIDVGLSSREAIGAWSWPDGRIRLSRALLDALDDDELTAAVAHEIGHLLDGGHVTGEAAALAGRGSPTPRDRSGTEARADALACAVLRARGARTDALPRMLRTVASRLVPGDDSPDPEALRARARAAEGFCGAAT